MKDFEDGGAGDRRQEIVFIGVLSETARAEVEKKLDRALLTEEEYGEYCRSMTNHLPPAHHNIM